ncbi:conserved hypothetical protein [Klebsiella pneumoniae]|nr:hypothetical protein UUU_40040 [Klebsiella pneumoniae subsp. pneumoniae DSM 30104 = JCM 1662 = NBRC 14940]CED75400.1 conserved hypothetical protein [Klebsiella pneumoniae]SAL92110.1 conserved hypothetical protein [Klebsiella pneumoniae]
MAYHYVTHSLILFLVTDSPSQSLTAAGESMLFFAKKSRQVRMRMIIIVLHSGRPLRKA